MSLSRFAAAQPSEAAAPSEAPARASLAPPLAQALGGAAKSDYDAARILYNDGDYRGAIEKLRSSYALSRDPRLLWNIAACEKNLRHYAAVLDLVERYVAEGAGYISESDIAEASALVATVKAFVVDLSVETNEAGATVLFDDQSKGTTPLAGAVHVDMGQHQLKVSKPGFVPFVVSRDFPGGKAVKISVTLAPEQHQGTLRIITDPADVIQIDGHSVGTGLWQGTLGSGTHAVFVSAKGKVAHQTDVVVSDNQVSTLHVELKDEPKPGLTVEKTKVPVWVWVAGGVLVAGGGVGAYFLLKPSGTRYQNGSDGTWGGLSLSLHR